MKVKTPNLATTPLDDELNQRESTSISIKMLLKAE